MRWKLDISLFTQFNIEITLEGIDTMRFGDYLDAVKKVLKRLKEQAHTTDTKTPPEI